MKIAPLGFRCAFGVFLPKAGLGRSLVHAAGVIAACGALFPANRAAAQQEGQEARPALSAFALSDSLSIEMDGWLRDAAWDRAVPISDFTQQEPVEGAEPSQPTEVRIAFDEDALYIGAKLFDDPDGILAYQRQRDASLRTDDRFMWILDTFRDGRTGYFFEINAAGLMGDGLLTGGGGGGGGGGWGGKAWDGIWEARTQRLPDGWSAEIRIPFRTLNFNPELDSWGINFQRTIRRLGEEILWRGHRRNQGLFRAVHAGDLRGLEGLSQGLGLEARPSAVASWRHVPELAEAATFPRDLSLDVNYSLTSSLRASASINTDFAEVESDQRRINLTRFPIRFPERRDFFLEGSGVFAFAPRSGPTPFMSRRIGLRDGEQIPIQYGTRLTGQAGRYELGFYQIGTESHLARFEDGANETLPREAFTVARVKRAIWNESSVGAIYTRRAAASTPEGFASSPGHTAGVDMQLNSGTVFGDKRVEFEAFVVWNSNPDPAATRSFGDLSARGLRLNYPNDIWSGHISYREFGDDYAPSLGFVSRNGFRRVEPRFGWSPRPDVDWIRQVEFGVQFRNLSQLGTGIVEERQWQLELFGIDFESGDDIELGATRTMEYLDNGFAVADGLEIRPGSYTGWEWEAQLRSSGRRRVSAFGGISRGAFWDGDRTRLFSRASLRPNPGISISLNFEHNTVSLPLGSFTRAAYEVEGEWNPNPGLSFINQLRYDDDSGLLGLFARARWIVRPGNDIFFVYTHNWRHLSDMLDHRTFSTISRGAAVKANYTYRF